MSKATNKKKGRRYSEAGKAAKLNWYQKLRAAGLTAAKAAKKVNVPYITLHGWEKKMADGKVSKAEFARIDAGMRKAAAKAKTPVPKNPGLGTALDAIHKLSGPCLVLKNGYRVYGPVKDLITVVKLLEASA